MNKKLLTLLGVSFMALSTGCVTQTSTPSVPSFDRTKVLADASAHSWVIHGNNMIGESVNGWADKSNDLYAASAMTTVSVDTVAALDKNLADTLVSKQVVALYTGEVTFGVNDSGWTTRVKKADGKLYDINGSYAFKVGKTSYSEELDVYATSQWVSRSIN